MHDTKHNEPLNICIVTREYVPRWVAGLLEHLVERGIGRITHHCLSSCYKKNRGLLPFRWLDALFTRLLRASEERLYHQPGFALQPVSAISLPGNPGVIVCRIASLFELPAALIAEGHAYPDIILNFTHELPPPYLPVLSPHGILSMQDMLFETGLFPAGLPEVGLNKGIIQTRIITQAPQLGPSWSIPVTSTVNASAYYYTVHNHFQRLSHRLQEMIGNLQANPGAKHGITGADPAPSPIRWYDRSFVFIMRYYLRKTGKWFSKLLFTERWILLLSDKGWDAVLEDPGILRPIKPPVRSAWADPFLLKQGSKLYVMYEEIPEGGKGHLNISELLSNGQLINTRTILSRNYHLSYPYVFNQGETWYMIPESSANHTIDLYRCTDFPGTWEFVCTLMDQVEANDTSVIFHNGKWWLFTAIKKGKNKWNYDDLYLFYSDTLDGTNWIPHPLNPVISDPRYARPAGRIFASGDIIHRVAQNCAYRYGFGIEVSRIESLTENSFAERPVHSLKPWKKSISGIHTLNRLDQFVIMDAKVKKLKWL